jgi:ketosteroid isomerase-like protein
MRCLNLKGRSMTEQSTHQVDDYLLNEHAPPEIGSVEHAMWLAHWHMAWENPDQLDKLAELYHPDIEWEIPGRRVYVKGNIPRIIDNYRAIHESVELLGAHNNDRYGTADRVFDDSEASMRLISSHGFPNHPVAVGSLVDMRIIHSFHIKDGLIIREISYELWRAPLQR